MRRPPEPRPSPPGPALSFRTMVAGDLDRVVQIELQGFAHPWSAELIRRELEHDWSTILLATTLRSGPGSTAALGARVEHLPGHRLAFEFIAGFVVYWLVHDEVHILNLVVAAEERRRGVGRALMAEASARARAAGAVLGTLEVRRSNGPALALYRELGWRQVGVRAHYYVDEHEDAIVMAIDL